MISPEEIKNIESTKQRSIKQITSDVDDAMKQVHGWYPWEEAILPYELTLHMRNRIANMYLDAGWKYVYHHTSSENLERPGQTLFRFSTEPLDRKYIRGLHTVTNKEV